MRIDGFLLEKINEFGVRLGKTRSRQTAETTERQICVGSIEALLERKRLKKKELMKKNERREEAALHKNETGEKNSAPRRKREGHEKKGKRARHPTEYVSNFLSRSDIGLNEQKV